MGFICSLTSKILNKTILWFALINGRFLKCIILSYSLTRGKYWLRWLFALHCLFLPLTNKVQIGFYPPSRTVQVGETRVSAFFLGIFNFYANANYLKPRADFSPLPGLLLTTLARSNRIFPIFCKPQGTNVIIQGV